MGGVQDRGQNRENTDMSVVIVVEIFVLIVSTNGKLVEV